MKRQKIFQRTDTDCGTAGLATLLGLSYEEAPLPENIGIDLDYLLYRDGHIEVTRSDVDDQLTKLGYQWGKGKAGRFRNPFKFYVGVVQGSKFTPKGYLKCHMVIMKGHKLWHDPDINGEYKAKDVVYSLTLKKI